MVVDKFQSGVVWLNREGERHVQGDVPIHVPGVVPIMLRGLCQALCSVMRGGQLSGLTCVNETSRTFRGGMMKKKKEEIAICRPRPS